jgi:hypothetical protein
MSRLLSVIRNLVKPRPSTEDEEMVPLATVWQMPEK